MVRISKKREKSYSDGTQQKPDKELLEQFKQLREILSNFNQNLLQIQTWGTRIKTRSRPAMEPWATALTMSMMSARPTGVLQGKLPSLAFSLAGSLKVTSGAAGFKVMDPFD